MCYGGDIRKRKLLRNKRKVKKRMRLVENVEIPRCVYIVS
jgi:translation elongation factor EF-4